MLTTWDIKEVIRYNLVNCQTLCEALTNCGWLLEDVKRCIEEDMAQDGRDISEWSDADVMRSLGYSLEMLLDLAVTIIHNEEREANK